MTRWRLGFKILKYPNINFWDNYEIFDTPKIPFFGHINMSGSSVMHFYLFNSLVGGRDFIYTLYSLCTVYKYKACREKMVRSENGHVRVMLQNMVMTFRVSELQMLLGFAGRNKSGRKNELQTRALDLLRLKSAPIQMKIRELYKSIQ